jgi:Thiamine monophosphate synthase
MSRVRCWPQGLKSSSCVQRPPPPRKSSRSPENPRRFAGRRTFPSCPTTIRLTCLKRGPTGPTWERTISAWRKHGRSRVRAGSSADRPTALRRPWPRRTSGRAASDLAPCLPLRRSRTHTPTGAQDILSVHTRVAPPVSCIGGIKRENLPGVLAARARCIVIVSGILQVPNRTTYCKDCPKLPNS